MSYVPEELTRAHMAERLSEAQEMRRQHHLMLAERKGRKAKRASLQARLALARSL